MSRIRVFTPDQKFVEVADFNAALCLEVSAYTLPPLDGGKPAGAMIRFGGLLFPIYIETGKKLMIEIEG